MAVVQATYSENIDQARAGMIANQETFNSITRQIEDAAGIGFGVAVFQGVADKGVTATAETQFVGITIRDVTLDPAREDEYAQRDSAGILTKGPIWVEVGGDVSAGDPVTLTAGEFDTGGTVEIPGAVYGTSGGEGDLVIVRLDVPVSILAT